MQAWRGLIEQSYEGPIFTISRQWETLIEHNCIIECYLVDLR